MARGKAGRGEGGGEGRSDKGCKGKHGFTVNASLLALRISQQAAATGAPR